MGIPVDGFRVGRMPLCPGGIIRKQKSRRSRIRGISRRRRADRILKGSLRSSGVHSVQLLGHLVELVLSS